MSRHTVVATVEARMGSTRLPGKTMVPLLGKPLLYRVLERIRQARTVKEFMVATSVNPADDGIARVSVELLRPQHVHLEPILGQAR